MPERTGDTVRVDAPDHDELPMLAAGECLQYVRSFNRPSGLQPDTVVRLVVESWQGQLQSVAINCEPISISDMPLQADITAILQAHNQIQIRLKPDNRDNAPRLTGEVSLQIES